MYALGLAIVGGWALAAESQQAEEGTRRRRELHAGRRDRCLRRRDSSQRHGRAESSGIRIGHQLSHRRRARGTASSRGGRPRRALG